MPPKLIVNADDFGLTPGINRAIAELHQAGAVSSTTLMANGPAFADAVRTAHSNPGLGVGCHLVFVDGMPVSHPEEIPTLLGADGKTFRPSLADFAQAVLRGTVRTLDLARETQAQIQKLQRAGLDVTHVDTHKHTHCFPAVAAAVLHIAGRCGVPAVRFPFEPAWSRDVSAPLVPLKRRLQARLLTRFEQPFRQLLRAPESPCTTDGTLGIQVTGHLDGTALQLLLGGTVERTSAQTEAVYELCCHPGYHDAALNLTSTRLLASRELERRLLLSCVPAFLQQPNAPELIHYGCLGVPGLQRASGQFVPNTGFEKVL